MSSSGTWWFKAKVVYFWYQILEACTIEENVQIATDRTHKFNVPNVPVFPKIPLANVVVDNLHMLWVGDVLIDMLIEELSVLDKVNKSLWVHSTEVLTHLMAYEAALKSIGIPGSSFWLGASLKKLKWKTLTGPEKLHLFTNFTIADHFLDPFMCPFCNSHNKELRNTTL